MNIKKSPELRRERVITFKMRSAEAQALEDLARVCGENKSELIRGMIARKIRRTKQFPAAEVCSEP